MAVATLLLAGVGLLCYPGAASWFFAVRQSHIVAAHFEAAEKLDPDDVAREFADARDYNEHVANGLIIDPFGTGGDAGAAELDDASRRYLTELDLAPDGIMSAITIPSIGAQLSIEHGATDAVLKRGAGHLYGSSLPVGGEGTHSIITAHSGIPEAELFSKLSKVNIGDRFVLTTLGEELHYEVKDIRVVMPTDIATLMPVPGEDLVTLVTCTPIGINTHRLLVQGTRVAPDTSVDTSEHGAGFPWWALPAGAAIATWITVLVRTRPRRAGEQVVDVPGNATGPTPGVPG
ncbi:sortase A [Mycolicibacterium mucogenicum 261Sha1.1M5]|nr:sortase A [Mycolicibacterium mucogenicum 261Sha1.1M5]